MRCECGGNEALQAENDRPAIALPSCDTGRMNAAVKSDRVVTTFIASSRGGRGRLCGRGEEGMRSRAAVK
jgi:hypothetical protein